VTLRTRGVVTVLVLALSATACGSTADSKTTSAQDQVQVTGPFGEKPTIKIAAPLKLSESESWTTVTGKGDSVGSEATVIMQLTLADGRTGETKVSTLDSGQQPLEIKLGEQVFPSLAKALVGKHASSRVVVASTSDDAYGDTGAPQIGIKGGHSVVMVSDILSTDPTSVLDGPTGASNPAPATAPRLVLEDGEPSGVDVTGLRKPKKLQVYVLREGTGPVLDGPHRIAADYLGQVWGAKAPFNNSYPKEPVNFTVGMSRVIPAWDKALAGVKEGARVMLVSPPKTAYGAEAQGPIPANATLVFVIDVLGIG
jgi:FKBP-type peptidyl-prolyl cis-trans isomerase